MLPCLTLTPQSPKSVKTKGVLKGLSYQYTGEKSQISYVSSHKRLPSLLVYF